MSKSATAESDFKFRIANAHSWLGGLAVQTGQLTLGLSEYDQQRTYLAALVTAEPRTPQWRHWLANAELFGVEVYLVTGKADAARNQLSHARRTLDEVTAYDPANRLWQSTSIHAQLLELELLLHDRSTTESGKRLPAVRQAVEELATAEPTDRLVTRWQIWALRLEARAKELSTEDGTAAAAEAVRIGESLIRQERATDADVSEYALACVLLGEIDAKHGRAADADSHWKRAADLLHKYEGQTREYQLLDPAVRAASWLHRDDVRRSLAARLIDMGYVPLEPFPP
jgi:hypothetical protein